MGDSDTINGNIKKRLIPFVLECLFPSKIECIVCGDELNSERAHDMCDDCFNSLPVIQKPCKKCGVSVLSDANYCLACKEEKFSFSKAVASFDYDGVILQLVHKFKYGGAKYLAKPLASFMAETFKASGFDVDCIVPVPVTPKRGKERGYNQAALLAREVSDVAQIEYLDILKRTKDTPTQAKLSRAERKQNLKGAFEVEDKEIIKGKKILVVDDVMTTGSTCEEIAKVLIKAKAKEVFVLTLAHTAIERIKKPAK